jgi:hypothetical protein
MDSNADHSELIAHLITQWLIRTPFRVRWRKNILVWTVLNLSLYKKCVRCLHRSVAPSDLILPNVRISCG